MSPVTADIEETPVLTAVADGVATITLNRPARMNAMHVALALELKRELQRLLADDGVRVLILTGAGEHFCTGADLKNRMTGPNGERLLDVLHDCFHLAMAAGKPFIAAVEGNSYGAGMSLAMMCDYVIAGDKARFCAPFTGVGLIPDIGLAWTLPARIGMGRARQMMFEGLAVPAEQALAWGMIEAQVPAGQALAAATERAHRLMARAPLALAALRGLLNRQWPDVAEFMREERRLQTQLQQSEDLAEGVRAFAERRAPRFTGR